MNVLNKNYFSTLLFTLCLATVSAQTVSYKVLEDNPYATNVRVHVLPFYVDWAGHNNLSLGYGLQASVVYKKLLTFDMYVERPYSAIFDWGYHFATVGIFSSPTVNVAKKFLHLELGATFHWRERTVVRTKNVVLSSYTSGRYTTTTSIGVPTTVARITGLRGGFYTYHTAITARQNGSMGGVVSSDGTRFGGAAILYANGNTDPNYNTESSTNMQVYGVYGGISSTSTYRMIIDADGYGKKGLEKNVNLYADLIIGIPHIDPLIGTDGKTYNLSGGQSKGFETRPFGLRCGLEYSFVRKWAGFYAKTEMGLKPGLAKSKFYIGLTWGLAIHGKITSIAAEK